MTDIYNANHENKNNPDTMYIANVLYLRGSIEATRFSCKRSINHYINWYVVKWIGHKLNFMGPQA